MKLVTREEWGAKPPKSGRSALHATFGTTVHYEGPRLGSFPHETCAAKVRGVQAFHMGPSRKWLDIAYTAVVCPHGYTYEGRWTGVRTAAQGTNEGNATSYAVCFLGGVDDPVGPEVVLELVEVLDFLRTYGGAGLGVNGHRDWHSTACPGDALYGLLGDVRARLDGRVVPAPPPHASPSHIDFPPFEEDALRTRLLTIPLGTAGRVDAGRGWADWDPELGRPPVLVGAVVNGREPAREGYGGGNVTPDVAASVRGNRVVVTAEEGTPGSSVGIWVTVA